METLAVIDFETTGLGATQGGRATEIAAVLVQGGEIVSRGPMLFKGYWGHPEATREAFIELDGHRFSAPATSAAWTTKATSS